MDETLRLRQTPTPTLRLRRSVLFGGALLVGVVVAGLWVAKRQIPPLSQLLAHEATPTPVTVPLPDALKAVERPYSELIPKPPIPVAQPVPKPPPPPVPMAAPVTPPVVVPAQTDPMPAFLDLMHKQQALSEKVATQQAMPPPAPPPAPTKPTRQPWHIKPTDITLRKEGDVKGEVSKGEKAEVARQGEASKLIQPAVWARPQKPWATLYRSQAIAGRTLDAINSDIPGQVRIELTIPVFDKFGYDHEILPKSAVVVAEQDGKPEYGQSRLAVKLIQIELPTSEVISLKAMVGDEKGNGVGGKVNAHIGKLLLATGINALLSLGGNSLAGTPTSFYANPAQQTARDVSQSVSRDAQKLVDAQLKVPPTITAPAGTTVSIALGENIVFSRQPHIVK